MEKDEDSRQILHFLCEILKERELIDDLERSALRKMIAGEDVWDRNDGKSRNL